MIGRTKYDSKISKKNRLFGEQDIFDITNDLRRILAGRNRVSQAGNSHVYLCTIVKMKLITEFKWCFHFVTDNFAEVRTTDECSDIEL